MQNDKNPGEITRLLHAWKSGDGEAQERLWLILYGELKSLAGGVLRRQGRGDRGQQATSLVHKAFLRLLGTEVDWNDRHHFFAVAARAMRFVLADEARRQLSKKRDGETPTLDGTLPDVADPLTRNPEEVLAVHQALTKLAGIQPRHEKLVELRYFAGLSVEETAEILAVTPRTVVRDWKTVRIWLHGELGNTA
jgi:RNA polymerase sigma factor (TIGR02999 family)